jgi:hypothetical protein
MRLPFLHRRCSQPAAEKCADVDAPALIRVCLTQASQLLTWWPYGVHGTTVGRGQVSGDHFEVCNFQRCFDVSNHCVDSSWHQLS